MTREHHPKCPRSQAWDVPDAPCRCPRGWPRHVHEWELVSLSYDDEDHEARTLRCKGCGRYEYERENN